jgi:hypothetical protein
MTYSQRFILSGWFSIVLAVISIPFLILAIMAAFSGETKHSIIVFTLSIISLGFSIYVLLSFRLLLNTIANFHRIDFLISLIIWVNVVVTIISVPSVLFPRSAQLFGILSMVVMIPLGILSIVFGVKLLKCEHELFGYLKTFSYLNIISGALMATVFLMLFSSFTSIAAMVLEALIFFNASKVLENETFTQVKA